MKKTRFILSGMAIAMIMTFSCNVMAYSDIKHSDAELFAKYGDVKVNHDNTAVEIVEKEKELKHNGFVTRYQTRYDVVPSLTAPYPAGSLISGDKLDALNILKMVRYLAGLPYEDMVLDETETDTAQHKAVLMAVAGYGHQVAKPDDMTDEFYNTANSYSAECIYAGISNLSTSILGFISDPGVSNIAKAGHRMILLNPAATKFGIGYAYNENDYWHHLIAVHVRYAWNSTDSYVAWPNSGDFPIQYFIDSTDTSYEPPYPWSISLGSPYNTPDISKLVIRLTRTRDNYTWIFDKNTPSLAGRSSLPKASPHLSINGSNIIFRPDVVSLGSIKDNDEFKVEISGLEYTDGSDASISYDIHFFDIERVAAQGANPVKASVEKTEGTHTANVSVENCTDTEYSGVSVYTVMYDKNNTPAKITSQPLTAAAGETSRIAVTVSDEDYIGADRIDLYVWDKMKPLCEKTVMK